jgi:thioredoxin reductase (NADPH)
MEEATFLTRFARSVTIVHRRDEFRASAIMLDRARKDPKIKWLTNAHITALHGETSVTGVTVADTRTGETQELAVTGVFVAIGHDPRSELFRDQVPTDAEGYVLTGPEVGATASTGTSIEGVFASGDLVDHTYRQAITAAGSGCAAALDAQHYLASHPLPIAGGAASETTDPMPDMPVEAFSDAVSV